MAFRCFFPSLSRLGTKSLSFPLSHHHSLLLPNRNLFNHSKQWDEVKATACLESNSIIPSHEWIYGDDPMGGSEWGPVVVFLHGILGSKRNWRTFARQYLELAPSHRCLLVDIRNHGMSSRLPPLPSHKVSDVARDIVRLEDHLDVEFDVVVGHSFSGKVVLSYADQRSDAKKTKQIWAIDTSPEGERDFKNATTKFEVTEILDFIQSRPFWPSRSKMVSEFISQTGLEKSIGLWLATSLVPMVHPDGTKEMEWCYSVDNVEKMFDDYKQTPMWEHLKSPPEGCSFHLVRAGRSPRWTSSIVERVAECEKESQGRTDVHLIEESGHWVHVDAPESLLSLLHSETVYL